MTKNISYEDHAYSDLERTRIKNAGANATGYNDLEKLANASGGEGYNSIEKLSNGAGGGGSTDLYYAYVHRDTMFPKSYDFGDETVVPDGCMCAPLNLYKYDEETGEESFIYIGLPIENVSGDKVKSIGGYAFSECASLTSVNFPKATSIGECTFSECASLTSVNLPEATSIGENAFSECASLTSVNFPKATSIGDYAFSECASLTSVNFPEATSIGECTFSNCALLTSVNLPEATSIGEYAFYACASLTSLILGNTDSVVTLSSVYAFGNTPFRNSPYSGHIYVPSSLLESYKTATNWKTMVTAYPDLFQPIEE